MRSNETSGLCCSAIKPPARHHSIRLCNLPQTQCEGDTKMHAQPRMGDEPQRYFGDLTNQDGKPLRFYTDILKGNVVMVQTVAVTATIRLRPCRIMIRVTFARIVLQF